MKARVNTDRRELPGLHPRLRVGRAGALCGRTFVLACLRYLVRTLLLTLALIAALTHSALAAPPALALVRQLSSNDRARPHDFVVHVTPPQLDICVGSDAFFTVDVGQVGDSTDPVTLSATGQPAGASASFVPNPVTPPASSSLTIGGTAAALPGSYTVTVVGAAGALVHDDTVILNISNAQPALPVLLAPANGALNVVLRPTFTWNQAAYATAYDIEVGTDPDFSYVAAAAGGVTDVSWTPDSDLDPGTVYYWRVRAVNGCGITPYSAAFTFTTAPTPTPTEPPTGVQLSRLDSGSPPQAARGWLPAALLLTAAVAAGAAIYQRRSHTWPR